MFSGQRGYHHLMTSLSAPVVEEACNGRSSQTQELSEGTWYLGFCLQSNAETHRFTHTRDICGVPVMLQCTHDNYGCTCTLTCTGTVFTGMGTGVGKKTQGSPVSCLKAV